MVATFNTYVVVSSISGMMAPLTFTQGKEWLNDMKCSSLFAACLFYKP
jgi:hypothetical protein